MLRSVAVDGTVAKDNLALGWVHCNVVGFHEGSACQYINIKVPDDEAFEGELSAFVVE